MRKTFLALAALAALSAQAYALSPSDLPTPEERAKYQQLAATNPADAQSYLITRDYVKRANTVVNGGGKGAREFPGLPKGFSSRFLSADGREKDTINEAVRMCIEAMTESRYA